ncbi:MAG: pirin family protein, partial [Candidatus Riflebacteria bacterium]|nr:pirin family protein [Candidatus Riflebacteria bacterium]
MTTFRKIIKSAKGQPTVDGAGVKLVRVLGHDTVYDFDPILMLDSFDSTNPEDYTAGFPTHPHRGIETISYIYRGAMTHKDSLGNQDTVKDGEVQWMTAGSGILHEEKLPATKRMLGVQLWLNMAAKDKMSPPAYHSIKASEVEEIKIKDGKLRLLAGEYEGHKGYAGKFLPLDYYDIHLIPNGSLTIQTRPDSSVMLFTLSGDARIAGELVKEKTAVKLGAGDQVELKSTTQSAQILFVSSTKLDETIVWGGPIVMNTKTELDKAFEDLKH